MELVRKPAQARVEIELERLGGLDPDELSSSRWLVRGGERRHGATAAAPPRPHVHAATALLDEIGRWSRDDDPHQREMIADARPLLLARAPVRGDSLAEGSGWPLPHPNRSARLYLLSEASISVFDARNGIPS